MTERRKPASNPMPRENLEEYLKSFAVQNEATRSQMQGFSDRLKRVEETQMEQVRQVATVVERVEGIRDDVSSLVKLIRDGNGQPALIHRVNGLGGRVKTLEDSEKRRTEEAQARRKSFQKALYSVYTSVIISVLGFLSMVLMNFFGYGGNGK